MSKRAQVTVFIIVGILMLFIFAGVMYVTKTTTKEKLTAEGEPVIMEVSQEFQPIKAFTENCLGRVGKRGLLVLGQQGGYIYPETLGEFSVAEPTDSLGINLEPVKVPYWHYNSEVNKGNTVVFGSLQPKLYYREDPEFSIEAQLMRFVKEKIDECLENYSGFEKQGFNISQGVKGGEVRVGEESVNFLLEMEVEARKGEAEARMEKFYVRIPLRLKHYYEVGNKIMEAEQDFDFLETHGLNLVSAFSGVEMEKLPPTSATTLELAPTVSWNEVEVKEKVKRVLSSYTPMLRFLGSANFYEYIYPDSELSGLYQRNYDQAVVNLRGAEELEVNFDYFDWPIYLKTNSVNGVIKPFHFFVSYWGLTMGQQNYETNYDVSWSVLVTIRDERAFNGEGYELVFSLEGNIRNNLPAEAGTGEGEEEVSFPVRKAARLACDEELWEAGELRTVVVDSFSKEPVEMVKIGFTIPEQDTCEVGFTDSEGVVESDYPAVYGGVMNLIKEDYLTNFYPIDTYGYKEKPGIIGYAIEGYADKVIEMHRLKKINISVKKKNLEKCLGGVCFHSSLFGGGEKIYSFKPEMVEVNHSWILTGVSKALKETEQAVITLERIGDLKGGVFSREFIQTAGVTGGGRSEVQLVPGIYKVSGMLVLEEEVVIPEEERCTGGVMEALACWDVDGCCFTFNETRMEKYMSGQLSWDVPGSYLRIEPEELYTSEELVFYVPSQNILGVPQEAGKRVVEDLQLMGELGNLSKQERLRERLEPRFN